MPVAGAFVNAIPGAAASAVREKGLVGEHDVAHVEALHLKIFYVGRRVGLIFRHHAARITASVYARKTHCVYCKKV